MNLATRLESLETDLAEQRAAWAAEVGAALWAAGTPAECAAFDRAIDRSLGEVVEQDDPDGDDRLAAELWLRLPQSLRDRGAILFPVEEGS